jgi:hypothetical protein
MVKEEAVELMSIDAYRPFRSRFTIQNAQPPYYSTCVSTAVHINMKLTAATIRHLVR